jgi:hypothetical protein
MVPRRLKTSYVTGCDLIKLYVTGCDVMEFPHSRRRHGGLESLDDAAVPRCFKTSYVTGCDVM